MVLFTSDDALELLAPRYAEASGVEVRAIPGLKFHYRDSRIDLVATIWQGVTVYLRNLRRLVASLAESIRSERPDLVVTDFEPALPRAAHRSGVPVLSVDHQHFLLAYDLSSLPLRLRLRAAAMAQVVRMYGIEPDGTVVSAFYRPPLRRGWERTVQVGPFLRPEILSARPREGDYLLSYLRPATPPSVLGLLEHAGRPVRIYGLGTRPATGSLTFCPIDEQRFVADLAGCAGLIAAAGNQLLGEALYFGKPVLALPEAHHHEQQINAHFIREMGCGDAVRLDRLTARDIERFVARRAAFAPGLAQVAGRIDGTEQALAEIERFATAPAHPGTTASVPRP